MDITSRELTCPGTHATIQNLLILRFDCCTRSTCETGKSARLDDLPQGCAKSVCDVRTPLFVFIVGETPTGGINKRQFFNAIRIMQDIRAASTLLSLSTSWDQLSQVPLSADVSLAQVPKDSFPHTVIHSGTVNSGAMIKCLMKTISINISPSSSSGHFRRVTVTRWPGSSRFWRRASPSSDVALLSRMNCLWRARVQSTRCCAIVFPREISGLRSAFQHDVQSEEYFVNGGKRPRSTLRSNLETMATMMTAFLPIHVSRPAF